MSEKPTIEDPKIQAEMEALRTSRSAKRKAEMWSRRDILAAQVGVFGFPATLLAGGQANGGLIKLITPSSDTLKLTVRDDYKHNTPNVARPIQATEPQKQEREQAVPKASVAEKPAQVEKRILTEAQLWTEAKTRKDIFASDFFKSPSRTNPKLTAFRDYDTTKSMQFPPSVHKHIELFKHLQKYGEEKLGEKLPLAVIEGLCMIESWGKENAVSSAKARGLFQVMPFHFSKGISEAEMMDPKVNGEVAMKVFVDALRAARKENPEYKPDSHFIYEVACIGYNAGNSTIPYYKDNKAEVTAEPTKYARYMGNIILATELEAMLVQDMGHTPEESFTILANTQEVNARSYALARQIVNTKNPKPAELREMMNLAGGYSAGFSDDWGIYKRTGPGWSIKQSYEEYFPTKPFEYALTPLTRVWTSLGNSDAITNVPENKEFFKKKAV